MPQVYDRGGSPEGGRIDQTEHEFEDWENSTHALVEALREEGIIYTEELRAGIEALPSSERESLSHYETWSASVEELLVEKNVLSRGEIDTKVREMETRWGVAG